MAEFKHFRVVLPVAVDTATIGEGFIDSRRTRAFSSLPTTFSLSQDKERAFIRWAAILDGLKLDTSPVSVTDIVETGGSQDSAPSQIDFTVTYKEDDVVYMWDLVASGSPIYGPSSVGGTATEVQVIERIIANALARANVDTPDIFDPTTTAPFGSDNTGIGVRRVIRIEDLTAAALGTGGDVETRRDNIEAQGSFTVTQL